VVVVVAAVVVVRVLVLVLVLALALVLVEVVVVVVAVGGGGGVVVVYGVVTYENKRRTVSFFSPPLSTVPVFQRTTTGVSYLYIYISG